MAFSRLAPNLFQKQANTISNNNYSLLLFVAIMVVFISIY